MEKREAKKYQKVYLYYFSGTGNAELAVNWFKKIVNNMDISCNIYDISKEEKIEIPLEKNVLIGFFAPTHGFNFPPIMLNFLFKFPKGKKQNVFFVNTRAGMKFWKFFLPGLSGATQLLAASILKIKNYKIVGMQPLDMPSNWISLHPGLRKKVILSIVDRCEQIISNFANKLIEGKNSYKAFWSLPFDIAVLPITVLYYLIGRFALAKTFYATINCTNCGGCQKNCPVHAIKEVNNRMFWTYKCESCMKCITNCPKSAIQISHMYTLSLWFIIISFISPLIVQFFFNSFSLNFSSGNLFLLIFEYFIEILVSLTTLIISYRIFHYFLKFSLFNKIIEYTSFTKYWRSYDLKKTLKKR